MSNTILIKRSDVPDSVPSAANLVPGELAINYNDGNLFFKDSSNSVVLLASTKIANISGNITGGNLNTGGQVVATGNITGGNLITVGNVEATGNVAGNFFIGNGSLLTGINVDATKIANGTTEVQAYQNGNVTFTIAGTANVVVVTDESVVVNGNVDVGNVNTTSATVTGNIKFLDSGSNFAGFEAPATITENVVYKLPPADGNVNNALVTDGSGNLSWKSILGGLLPVGTRDSGIINVETSNGFLTVGARDGNVLVPV